jgi:hypothetical protein
VTISNLRSAGGAAFEGGFGGGSPKGFWDSPQRNRAKRLYDQFSNRQHLHKRYDFDGRVLEAGVDATFGTQPLMTASPVYVPLRDRRPSMPYRLAHLMVTSFTSMLLGEHRFPELVVPGDATTQEFVKGLSEVMDLPARMQRIRNLGGATGAMTASWGFVDGKPRVRPHNSMNICVHEWEDADECVVRHASEVRVFPKLEIDRSTGRSAMVDHWYRRDWTMDSDLVFFPVRCDAEKPEWVPDPSRSFKHDDKICHLVYAQNLPSDGESGESDFEGLLENFETLDVMLSILSRGAILNLDPTLKLKMDPDLVDRGGVQKGSDHSLVVGEAGDAAYMELAGTSITAGINLFNAYRALTLETGQCVVPDPDKIAAAGTSAVALKVVYAPMTHKVDILRQQTSGFLKRLLEPMLAISQSRHGSVVRVWEPTGEVDEEDRPLGIEKEYEDVIVLPPYAKEDPSGELGDDGLPKTVMVEREPGNGRSVDPEWPDYFLPTPSDQTATLTAVGGAAGGPGTVVLSRKTASGIAAKVFGKDPAAEWVQIQKEQDAQTRQHLEMFAGGLGPSSGGDSKKTLTLPSGASMTHTQAAPPPAPPPAPAMPSIPAPDAKSEKPEPQPIPVTPTLAASAATVNEFRKMWGLEPLNGPDGDMPLAAYAAKYSQPIAIAANAANGQIGTAPAGGPPKAPAGGPPGMPPPPFK